MKNSLSICIVLLYVLLPGCEEEYSTDIPDPEQQAVINCLFHPDTSLTLYISTVSPVNKTYCDTIKNATVRVYDDNGLFEELSYTSGGYYKSTNTPIEQHEYTIKAEIPGFEQISASTQVPAKPKIISATRKENVFKDKNDEFYSMITLSFNEPSQKENYYEIALAYEYRDSIDIFPELPDTGIFKIRKRKPEGHLGIKTKDPRIMNEGMYKHKRTYHSLIFSDIGFDEEESTFSILYSIPYTDIDTNYNLYVYFNAISKEYYLYKKKIITGSNQTGSLFARKTPVHYYTNITNGLGIFAGYNTQKDTIKQ